MKTKSLLKNFYNYFAATLSAVLCVVLIVYLFDRYENHEAGTEVFGELTGIFIAISGFLAAILLIFLATSAMNLKATRAKISAKAIKTTQKMHHFRTIAGLLLNSNIWPPGLKDYMEKNFPDLSYFEVKEFYKVNSKIAIEFLQETHHYGGTENIYLELKSLLMDRPDQKQIPKNLSYPLSYGKAIVEKWATHKCGSGLWYVFGYKYGNYKDSIQLANVYERHQEKILALANTIDREVFEDSSFNEVFMTRLWEYMTQDVLPKLVQIQDQLALRMPPLLRYLYIVFLLLMIFGVMLPLLFLMLNFSSLIIMVSFSVVISSLFYIAITFHSFLAREMEW